MKSLTLLSLFFISTSAIASGEYEFCVDRTSNSTHEVVHAKFNYGDIDPGKEAARILVSQRYKKADTTSVAVTDYDSKLCNASRTDSLTVEASGEQLQNLANAVGRGDVPGAVVVAADIVAGGAVSVVENAGNALDGAKKFICGIFGC